MNMTHLRLYQAHQAVRALIIYQLLYHYQMSENYRQLQAFFYLAAHEKPRKIPVNQKTASRANSKKTGKSPSIKEPERGNSIRLSLFSIEKLRQARYFDHKSYRFNSVDPIINREEALYNPQLWNLYAYCNNNPITYYDPDGRISESMPMDYEQKAAEHFLKASNDPIVKFFAIEVVTGYATGGLIKGVSAAIKWGAKGIKWLKKFLKSRKFLIKATKGQIKAFQRQLIEQGRASLLKSRNSLLRRLEKHLKDLKTYKKAGGYTSKTEQEIRNFRQQIKAIDEVLGKNK